MNGHAQDPAVLSSPWATQPNKHVVMAHGHPLTLWEKSPQNPTDAILLLHGRTWSSLPDFDLQVPGERLSLMENLVHAGLAVYALDLRGYGPTPRNSDGWLTPELAAGDVACALQWIDEAHPDLDRPVLMGWSQGASVAWFSEQNYSKLASRLVLYGFSLDPTRPMVPVSPAASPPRNKNDSETAAEDFITPGTISELAIKAFTQAAMSADPVYVDWRNRDHFNLLDPHKINIPTLLVHGEWDPYVKKDGHGYLFPRIAHPNKTWAVIPGGDHMTHLENCRYQLIEVIVGFLARSRPLDCD